jgi:hypothetical protein
MVTAQGSSLLALLRCTYHCFLLMDFLRLFWPQDVFEEKVAPIWYPAAAQLATATVCHVSFCMEHLPAQQQLTRPPALLDCLLGSARMTVVVATIWWWTGPVQDMSAQHRMQAHSSSSAQGDLQQLVQELPLWLTVAALALLFVGYGLLLQDEQQPEFSEPEHENARSQDAWSIAASHSCTLPASHMELLLLLGCSSKALI